MSNYSKEEIQEFKNKDLRISKLAIVKSLIEKLSLEDVYGVEKITELAGKYIDYVYIERNTKRDDAGCITGNTIWQWGEIATGLNIAIPNSQNIKILNQIADEYKKAYKAIANPDDILVHIMNTFGRYPEKQSSIKTILESLKGEKNE